MKDIKGILIILVFLVGLNSNVQSQTRKISKGKIGFTCDDTGAASWTVKKVSKLIDASDHKAILKLIDSRNPAEQFLGVIAIETFTELGKIKLTKEIDTKISKLYSSKKIIEVCEGCIYVEKVTLKELLDKKVPHRMNKNAIAWLESKIENNK